MDQQTFNTDVVIVGAGAAGLMAGATAGECGLRAVLLERKHLPGRKLLLCGNNRCNVTRDCPPAEMLDTIGQPVAALVTPALQAFGPRDLRDWFQARGLQTRAQGDRRVFPRSENADDVLHCFQDQLRTHSVPLTANAPAKSISREAEGYRVDCDRFALNSRYVLLATGGVSYPKTGSVGDGQTFARALGHHVEPYRPGLVGYELGEPWIRAHPDAEFTDVCLSAMDETGRRLGQTRGGLVCTRWGVRGPAAVNMSRLAARHGWAVSAFDVDFAPRVAAATQLADVLARARTPASALQDLGMDPRLAREIQQQAEHDPKALARRLKSWPLTPLGTRPLKEAMVTVGGVRLDEVEPATMESRLSPGLFLAGEVLDIDGPTGGYNLQMAFATARLAMLCLAQRLGAGLPRPTPPRPGRAKPIRQGRRPTRRKPGRATGRSR